MIKNRSLMIGIGIGIILGAVLLQLVNIGKGQTMLSGAQLTPEQIQQAAQAQNMQVYTADQKVYTKEQWQELVKQEEEKKKQSQQSGQQSTTKEPEETKQPTSPESPEQPSTSGTKSSTSSSTQSSANGTQSGSASGTVNTPSQPTTPTTTTKNTASTNTSGNWFTVSSGQMLNDIAFNLKKQGLIKSQGDFINRASQLNVNKKLQVGSYQISSGQSYDDILRTLSGQSSP
ncbi:hypothetical protein L2089_05670 [Paenibacillus hunanensis]|uniref:hypothetical protein n=1 Tax=Paenibacillus hunanensis TaxID=539262 RepID=UPI0020274126|nr:hypothetical protein [Paenibacillus hunanensis]MCL9660164.1 hypothetical protein [Paenibacillus hunanensis]